jgi:hypothetical protein
MPVHDWTRIDAGTFHAFHTAWVTHLMEALNGGLLPPSYYALAEQVASQRRVAVRHITGHRVVAVIEVVSPANKDARSTVRDFVANVAQLLQAGIQVLVIDLLPQGRFDPEGIHGAVWSYFDRAGYQPRPGEAFTLASYRADGAEPEVFLEPVGLGRPLTDMPLFLNRERCVNVPLEKTYLQAYEGFPAFWKHVLEGGAATDGS